MPEIIDPVTQSHVRQAARGLKTEFAGIFSEETIERYIADSLDKLEGWKKINVFVPVLAHRFARERLKALAQAGQLVSKEQLACLRQRLQPLAREAVREHRHEHVDLRALELVERVRDVALDRLLREDARKLRLQSSWVT